MRGCSVRRAALAVFVVAIGAAGCGTANPPVTLPATLTADDLPAAARAALDGKWHGTWHVANVDAQNPACPDAGKTDSAILARDFNDDGRGDIAAAVDTPQGRRLVVLINRNDSYDLFDVDGLGDASATEAFGVQARGATFTRSGASAGDYYSADTLTKYGCKQRTSYMWNGLTFEKVLISSGRP